MSYFASERNTWGMAMRRSVALVLPFILPAACATTVPLDLSELEAFIDAGQSRDGGFATASTGGFPSEMGGTANGGFQSGAGGFAPAQTGGRAAGFPPFGAGGRTPLRGTGGAPAPVGRGGSTQGRGGTMNGTGGVANPAGGATGAGGASCREGEKLCGGVCVSPAPRTGCGTTGCDPCTNTAPANGVVVCNNGQCDFSCLSGYTKTANGCTAPAGTGGATGGGGGGTPGPAVSCGGTTCPSCSVILGPACCNGNQCGCPLIPWTAGFLGCI